MEKLVRFLSDLEDAKAGRRAPLLFGILNVTPDSFSDGGDTSEVDARVGRLLDERADVIDIGGESTRPGATPVSEEVELARVLPAVRAAVLRGAVVSIDTQKAKVAEAALAEGASILNDVSMLKDPRLAEVAARFGAAYVLMHSRATHAERRDAPSPSVLGHAEMFGFGAYPEDGYRDVVSEVVAEWRASADKACALGLPRARLIMDPGFGFAKSALQSEALLLALPEIIERVGVPVLAGASRKSFLTLVDGNAPPKERLGASIAVALFAAQQGALLLRVHDVRATRQALAWSIRLARPRPLPRPDEPREVARA